MRIKSMLGAMLIHVSTYVFYIYGSYINATLCTSIHQQLKHVVLELELGFVKQNLISLISIMDMSGSR